MSKLAFLGAGQLALMTLPHAHRLGLKTVTVDSADAPAHHLAHETITGSLKEIDVFERCAEIEGLTHATADMENISLEGVRLLEARGITVTPHSRCLELIQDKGKQREFFDKIGIPGPSYFLSATRDFYPRLDSNKNYIVKKRVGGYDGKGVFRLSQGSLPEDFHAQLLIEEEISIKKELAILMARNKSGEVRAYEPVEMIFDPKLNLLDSLYSPARLSEALKEQMLNYGTKIINELNYNGLLAIEFFLDQQDQLLVNEMAPRPHNSGHQTQLTHRVDQFEQHLRAVMNWPLASSKALRRGYLINLVGLGEGKPEITGLDKVLKIPDSFFQWYGKETVKPGRKMAHLILSTPLEMNEESALQEMQTQHERIKEWLKIQAQ